MRKLGQFSGPWQGTGEEERLKGNEERGEEGLKLREEKSKEHEKKKSVCVEVMPTTVSSNVIEEERGGGSALIVKQINTICCTFRILNYNG